MTGGRQANTIHVEVACALPRRQALIAVETEAGATVSEAIRLSGVLAAFPEIDLQQAKVGIFGQVVSLATPVRDGDRVEIYRPLILEPKQGRSMRAQLAQQRRRRR